MPNDAPDYKDTVFLPETAFPMRAGLPQREPAWLARWEAMRLYDRLRAKPGRPPFLLHDGPPYANGHLHIGHALNKILKDLVVRSHQMLGHDARYVPGWDCHGLPIEWKVEEEYRKRGQSKDAVPVLELRAECRRFAEHWVGVQRAEFRRLGVTGDWDHPYRTMDFDSEAVIADEFMKFVMNGALYRGSKPVMWSVVEKTALAEAEVEYRERESPTVWVGFPVIGHPGAGGPAPGATARWTDVRVVIWTTTPWTIPSNRAIAFNPALSYGLWRVTAAPDGNWAKAGDRLLLADRLAEEVFRAARVEAWEREDGVTAAELAALVCAHPFRGLDGAGGEWDYDVPLLPGDHVTDEAGTGFVHTAPSHGLDDFELGQKHRLPMTHNVLADGSFRADLPFFGGLLTFDAKGKEGKANAAVIAKLAEAGALLARGRLRHSYPHSWRSKAPLIYRNTPQWFVSLDTPLDDGRDAHGRTIRARALASIDGLVRWVPESGRSRLRSMVETRPDWVLSRQRAWGVPLTCFVHRETGALLRDRDVNARIVAAFRAEGADAWYRPGAKERFLGNGHDPEAWEKIDDILDVWFESGATHAFVLRDRPDGTPDQIADVYLEGTDQHRGWFHSSLLEGCGTIGRAPYRAVVTHGFTLDEKGEKMSKSAGNVVEPATVIAESGADILRLWVVQTDFTEDQRIGPEILKGVADTYRRLRNTLRFLLGALNGFTEAERVAPGEMPDLERWVLHRLAELDGTVRRGYRDFAYQDVFQAVFQFATDDLSAFFFDIRKDALYCDAPSDPRRRATRTVLDAVFHRLVTWLAPMLVFTAEEVWLERYPGEESSVHLEDFPPTPAEWRDDALAARWAEIRAVRRVVNGALEVERREKRIGASLEAAPVVHVEGAARRDLLAAAAFAEICITSAISVTDAPAPPGAFTLPDVAGVAVVPAAAPGAKCQRCWRILPDVGTHAHPGLCARCNSVVTERIRLQS